MREGPNRFSLRSAIEGIAQTLEPAGFSGFINLRSSLDLIERGSQAGLQAPVAFVDGAVRLSDVVAESEGYLSFREDEPTFRRTGSRFVYDDLRSVVRYSLGDVRPFARTFQSSSPVAGISAQRFYSELEPWREFRSTGSQSFTIFSPSTVETIVNGRSVERKLLQPGNYTLQDFPLAEGANDVRLVVEDQAGQQRSIDFNLYSNRLLLQPGVTEFSAFAGVYTSPTSRGLAYSNDWAASGFVRKGLSQQVTAGAKMQADAKAQQVGGELLLGTSLGLIGFDLAASRRSDSRVGHAGAMTSRRSLRR